MDKKTGLRFCGGLSELQISHFGQTIFLHGFSEAGIEVVLVLQFH